MGGRRARSARGAAAYGRDDRRNSKGASLDDFFSSASSGASIASTGANTHSKDRKRRHRRGVVGVGDVEGDAGTIADATILGRRFTHRSALNGSGVDTGGLSSSSSSRRTVVPRAFLILLGCVVLSILTNRGTAKRASKQTKNGKAGYDIYKDPFLVTAHQRRMIWWELETIRR